jgi:hypothetical protein
MAWSSQCAVPHSQECQLAVTLEGVEEEESVRASSWGCEDGIHGPRTQAPFSRQDMNLIASMSFV